MILDDTELDHIAVELGQNERHGGFLRRIGEAWQVADMGNRETMRPLFKILIRKYNLEELLNYEYGVNKGRRVVEENL